MPRAPWKNRPYHPGTVVDLAGSLNRILEHAMGSGLSGDAELIQQAIMDGWIEVASDSTIYVAINYGMR